jgi:hypothetical protein
MESYWRGRTNPNFGISRASSAIALPSFGSEPDGTNSIEPPSLVTARRDAANRSCRASLGEVHSAFSVITSLSPARVTNHTGYYELGPLPRCHDGIGLVSTCKPLEFR